MTGRRLVRRVLAIAGFLWLGAGGPAFAQAPTHFVQPPALLDNGSDTTGLAVADLDLDGHLDLIVAACDSGLVRVRQGLGDGTFGPEFDFPGGVVVVDPPSLWGLAVADFDGDGYPDIATGNLTNTSVSILLNAGTGFGVTMFGAPVEYSIGDPDDFDGVQAITAADFDGVNGIDLAIAVVGDCCSHVTILLNNGDGSFSEAPDSPYSFGWYLYSIQARDMDGNGTLDLVLPDNFDDVVYILKGDGDGTFTDPPDPVILPVDTFPSEAAILDYNSDDVLDMVVAPGWFSDQLVLVPGNPLGGFDAPTGMTTSLSGPNAITAADFNADGFTDVAVVDMIGGGVLIFDGDGSGFVEGAFFVSDDTDPFGDPSPVLAAGGDFNEDGKPDLAIGHAFTDNTGILINDTCCFVTVTRDGTGSGSVVSDIAGIDCGSTCVGGFAASPPDVVLTATPAPGSLFAGWAGACAAYGTGPCTLTLSADVSVTATFDVLALSPPVQPGGTVGSGYSSSVSATNGTGPYTFTLLSGALPPGIDLTDDGLIVGTALAGGTFNVTVGGTDANGAAGSIAYSIVIAAGPTTTTAADAAATYSAAAQSVGLVASVSNPVGVYSGTVTFTVRDAGSVQIGPTVSGAVVDGIAFADYTLLAGTPPQTLTITAEYGGDASFLTSTGTGSLVVELAPTAIAAANATATYNSASQIVPLTATVTNSSPINEGTVTFTVFDSSAVMIGAPVTSAPVSGGVATANYSLPGGTGAQTLSITAVYNPTAYFLTSTDTTHTLTIGPASTSTAAANATATFSSVPQFVPLSANVTSPNGTVDGGTLTFTVRTGSLVTVGAPVTAPVSGGVATGIFTLPASTPAQTLTVTAVFTDASPNLQSSTGTALLFVACPAMDVQPSIAPTLRLGYAVSLTFTAVGPSDSTLAFTGTPPPGLTFDGATLSGTPTTLGQFSITATATSAASGGCTGSRTYPLTVFRPLAFVTGAGGVSPRIRTFDPQGTQLNAFLADDAAYAGGVRVAMGDVTGDGVADIITAPGRDAATAMVRVVDGSTLTLIRQFQAYPYSSPGGTYVAAGDVNGDGIADIVTGRDGSPPEVKVFDGFTGAVVSDFFAYAPPAVGGVRVAVGDVDGDGFAEIITGKEPGGTPEVRVFSGDGTLRNAFMAYDPLFQGGVFVAAGDVDGDGRADIVTGADASGGPHVVAFSGADLHVLHSFFAYTPLFAGGVRVAVGDVDQDGYADIVTGAGPGGGPHVRVWSGATGAEIAGLFAYEATFAEGVYVAAPPAQTRMAVNPPGEGATVPPVFGIGGWVGMGGAVVDNGVDAIHAWAWRVGGESAIFVGATTTGVARPDVAAIFGSTFALSGFNLTAGPLPPGTYDLVVYAHSSISGTWAARRIVRITVTP